MSSGIQQLAVHNTYPFNICYYCGNFIEIIGHIAVGRPVGGNKTETLNLENFGLKTIT